MNKTIEVFRQPRIKILDEIAALNLDQLNRIPAGFNNNIIWNLGHMIAAQQGVCYARAGLAKVINDDFFMSFKPDSKPERFYEAADVDNIKSLLFSTLDQLAADLEKGIFGNYKSFTTRYGVEISNIDDAVRFLPFHDGLHSGYIMSIRKLV